MSALTEPEKLAYVNERWAAMRAPAAWNSLLTEHLPVDVVREDLYVWIANTTMPDDPRDAGLMVACRVGDRENGIENPQLTPDDAEYLVATLLHAARKVWLVYGDGRSMTPGGH